MLESYRNPIILLESWHPIGLLESYGNPIILIES
jgi:hypothetical protein